MHARGPRNHAIQVQLVDEPTPLQPSCCSLNYASLQVQTVSAFSTLELTSHGDVMCIEEGEGTHEDAFGNCILKNQARQR